MQLKKSSIFFLVGGLTGVLIIFPLILVFEISPLLVEILYFPGNIIEVVDPLLIWLAKVFNDQSNITRGLRLDGGPLEWVEWASFFLAMFVWYGLLGILIGKLIAKWKSSHNKKALH